MKLRTEIILPESEIKIEHHHNILTMGSCFARNISEYFKAYRFNILSNPFGVLYNPLSIYNSLKLVNENKIFTKEDLVFDQGEFHSFYHHSDFSHHDPNICINKINEGLTKTKEFLTDCDRIIITFGTAFVYGHKEKGIVVSNCHKLPASQFVRYMLSVSKTREIIESTIKLIKHFNRNVNIILTVSPVRHLKEGAFENQLSKSTLLLALNEIIGKEEGCAYFPSFELMMDDLRDYRYYDIDMIHPNETAVKYIWEKFSHCHFTNDCLEMMKETIKIENARRHVVRNKNSERHKKFINDQIFRIKNLIQKYPYLQLEDDLKYFLEQKKE